MFIRVKTTPNSPRRSVQICQNYRVGEKVKQKIIHYVGIARDQDEENQLKAYAEQLIIKITLERQNESKQLSLLPLNEKDFSLKNKKGRAKRKKLEDILPPNKVALTDIIEESRIVEGVHEIGGVVFDEVYSKLFKSKRLAEKLKDIVLLRLVSPCSKHLAHKKLMEQFNKNYSLDSIYRMMDALYPKINDIKKMTFESTRSLFPHGVDLILFDVTTLYFESIEVDELRNFGYSKDHRFNTTQVVLALATNQEGLPVGYELFHGNCAEVSTLLSAIQSWKTLFKIESVCFVGDRAMFTKKNIELLEGNNCQYIIAAKLRVLPKLTQEKLFEEKYYRATVLNKSLAWIGEFNYENARLIVSYKTQRAIKDTKERETVLKKINKLIGKKGNPHKLITNTGVKKFLTKDEEANIQLDQDKINQDAQWDGLHGIITNIKEDSAESLIARYSRLWIIEESFRVNKHNLQMRPIYHWKPERIHAHIAICYMTFAILRQIQYRVNLTQKISINEILHELLNVQASIHVHKTTKDKYRLPGYLSNNARKIYKTFRLTRSLDAEIYQ